MTPIDPDEGLEFIQVGFDQPLFLTRVVVHQGAGPGALSSVEARPVLLLQLNGGQRGGVRVKQSLVIEISLLLCACACVCVWV